MKVAYFVHELEDPAVRRRIGMLAAGGAEVALFGFERGRHGAAAPDGAHSLGRTEGGRLISRIGSVLAALPRAQQLEALWGDADVLVARNLEMLAIVVVLARLSGLRTRIVYECLDIHRLMSSEGASGKLLRALERDLLKRVALVLTSSPAFLERHFRAAQGWSGESLIVENKVLALAGPPPALPAAPPSGPPWRIAWCGVLRCRRSLEMLAAAARDPRGLAEVILWGAPARDQMPDFDAVVTSSDRMTFNGRYAAEDLPRIYGDAHFVWAVDYYEAGGNSDWLLPNRLYEGLAYGATPIAADGVETARWLAAHGVGVVLDEPLARSFPAFLQTCTPESFRALRAATAALDRRETMLTVEDCRALTAALTGAAASVRP